MAELKVKDLIALLQKQDPEMYVLSGDDDDWYYDLRQVQVKKIKKGRVNQDGEECVCID